MKDKLGREVCQGDTLVYASVTSSYTAKLFLTEVIDGCSFALKLKHVDTGHEAVVDNVEHMLIVKRKGL